MYSFSFLKYIRKPICHELDTKTTMITRNPFTKSDQVPCAARPIYKTSSIKHDLIIVGEHPETL